MTTRRSGPNPIDRIDHALIAVRDLVASAADYARLGFALTPRGRHPQWGTENACIMFPQDYIELLGIADPALVRGGLDKFLAERQGFYSIALGSDDAEATAALLSDHGFPANVEPLNRGVMTESGPATLGFKLVRAGADAFPAINGFVCQHLTPDLLRHPDWLDHPNGAIGLANAAVMVDDPVAVGDAYGRLLGVGAVVPTDDMVAVHFGRRHVVLFLSPDDAAAMYPDLDEDDEATPQMIGLTVRVRDVKETAAVLKQNGIGFDSFSTLVRVDPEYAAGVTLDFLQDR